MALGDPKLKTIQSHDYLFKIYTPKKMLDLWLKKYQYELKDNFMTNAHSSQYETQHYLSFEIFDKEKNLKLKK